LYRLARIVRFAYNMGKLWGPFRRDDARCVIVSLEDPEGFIAALETARRAAA